VLGAARGLDRRRPDLLQVVLCGTAVQTGRGWGPIQSQTA
jgi:hypothetical protein